MAIFKNNRGIRCDPNQDGTITCRPYKVEKNEKLATGTEVTISTDPNNECKPIFTGGIDLLDEDEKAVVKAAKMVTNQCKKGF